MPTMRTLFKDKKAHPIDGKLIPLPEPKPLIAFQSPMNTGLTVRGARLIQMLAIDESGREITETVEMSWVLPPPSLKPDDHSVSYA